MEYMYKTKSFSSPEPAFSFGHEVYKWSRVALGTRMEESDISSQTQNIDQIINTLSIRKANKVATSQMPRIGWWKVWRGKVTKRILPLPVFPALEALEREFPRRLEHTDWTGSGLRQVTEPHECTKIIVTQT